MFRKEKPPIAYKVQQMKTLEDFETIRQNLLESYLPEPQGMNSLLDRLGNETLGDPKGELPLRIKRYVYETKQSIKYAQDNKLTELHIVVGCAHELSLEYLLKNPRLLNRLHI